MIYINFVIKRQKLSSNISNTFTTMQSFLSDRDEAKNSEQKTVIDDLCFEGKERII